jgi:hypothetical protein
MFRPDNPLLNPLKEIILAASIPMKLADIKKELKNRGIAFKDQARPVTSRQPDSTIARLYDISSTSLTWCCSAVSEAERPQPMKFSGSGLR